MLYREIEAEAIAGLGLHQDPPCEVAPLGTTPTWNAGRRLEFIPLQLGGMSLGQTQTYAQSGGLRVYSDDSSVVAPHDIARDMTRCDAGAGSTRVVAAFPVGSGQDLAIRIMVRGIAGGQRSLQIRTAVPRRSAYPRPG